MAAPITAVAAAAAIAVQPPADPTVAAATTYLEQARTEPWVAAVAAAAAADTNQPRVAAPATAAAQPGETVAGDAGTCIATVAAGTGRPSIAVQQPAGATELAEAATAATAAGLAAPAVPTVPTVSAGTAVTDQPRPSTQTAIASPPPAPRSPTPLSPVPPTPRHPRCPAAIRPGRHCLLHRRAHRCRPCRRCRSAPLTRRLPRQPRGSCCRHRCRRCPTRCRRPRRAVPPDHWPRRRRRRPADAPAASGWARSPRSAGSAARWQSRRSHMNLHRR